MSWMRFLHRKRSDSELQDEIEAFLTEETADNEARGQVSGRGLHCRQSLPSETPRSRPATRSRSVCGVGISSSSLRAAFFTHHKANCAGHLPPAAGFANQLPTAFCGQPVELCLAIVLARTPI